MKRSLLFPLILMFCLTPLAATADSFDGSSPLLCALTQAVECMPESGCESRSVEDVNLPLFVRIDFEKKQLSAAGNPENARSTTIQNMEQNNGMTILQGAENGRGWTIDMNQETGKFTAAIAEDRAGFIVFGACLPFKN